VSLRPFYGVEGVCCLKALSSKEIITMTSQATRSRALSREAETMVVGAGREFCGHGVGRVFHTSPTVLHFRWSGVGTLWIIVDSHRRSGSERVSPVRS
jgi:methionine aminopeptidase